MTGGGVPTDEDLVEIAEILNKNGVNLYDSAEGYGFGESEKRLTRAVRGLSPAPLLMTKFMPTAWRWTREAFFESLRRSSERLGSVPDVYFVHTPVHPLFLQWVACAFEAKRRGLVKAVGLSNCSYDDVVAALEVAERYKDTLAANQVSRRLLELYVDSR